MIDFLLAVIFTPSKAWIGIIIGILVSACIYFFFPESELRNTFAMAAVVAGFLIGLVLSADMDKK
jgi:membrane associated rhomboid family serine protease